MYSLTQAGNITALAGTLGLVLHALNVNIAPAEIEALISSIIAVGGILISWYGRYRTGDLTLGGFRK